MNPFDQAPEFLDLDNRKLRTYYPVSSEHLKNKHEVLFPNEVVKGKHILDLGSCMGATGHWCLSLGASWYTGIETQKTYADLSRQLLQKYHPGSFSIEQASVEDWLEGNTEKFDVVSALGILFAFADYHDIMRRLCEITDTFIIEGPYPDPTIVPKDFCGVQFLEDQRMVLADQNASLIGRASRISPNGLHFLMREFGFESKEGLLYPKRIEHAKDMYNDVETCEDLRYLMRFTRTGVKEVALSEDLRGARAGEIVPWSVMADNWGSQHRTEAETTKKKQS